MSRRRSAWRGSSIVSASTSLRRDFRLPLTVTLPRGRQWLQRVPDQSSQPWLVLQGTTLSALHGRSSRQSGHVFTCFLPLPISICNTSLGFHASDAWSRRATRFGGPARFVTTSSSHPKTLPAPSRNSFFKCWRRVFRRGGAAPPHPPTPGRPLPPQHHEASVTT